MSETQALQSATPEALALARELAREMANAKARWIRNYHEQEKRTLAEAEVLAGGQADVDWHERTKSARAQQVDWYDLSGLAEADPIAAQAVWTRIAEEATDEMESGDRAARVLESDGSPWERARFLVLRAALREELKPHGGVEAALVDTLALSYHAYLFWLGQLHRQSTFEARCERISVERNGNWTPPTVSHVEAVEQSAAMADRFNRLFLRTLRALRDLRRYSPPVVIQNAGQVNVGERQVNVTAHASMPTV